MDTIKIREPEAFSLIFSWKDKSRTITLNNGEDILKIANAIEKLFSENDIPCTISDTEVE